MHFLNTFLEWFNAPIELPRFWGIVLVIYIVNGAVQQLWEGNVYGHSTDEKR